MAAPSLIPAKQDDVGPTNFKSASTRHDLTDEQIDQLLLRASLRIQTDTNSSTVAASTDTTRPRLPKLQAEATERPLLITEGNITRVQDHDDKGNEREKSIGIRKVEDPVYARALAKEKKSMTAGSQWFDLPKTKLTPELKRDLQLLKMRNVLDPHRHYKKDNGKMSVPEYSQVGTIVEGAAEFYSGRLENKQRKRTFVEEVLAGEQETGRFKRKYGEVQAKKGSGKKAFYKGLQAKRQSGVKKGG